MLSDGNKYKLTREQFRSTGDFATMTDGEVDEEIENLTVMSEILYHLTIKETEAI